MRTFKYWKPGGKTGSVKASSLIVAARKVLGRDAMHVRGTAQQGAVYIGSKGEGKFWQAETNPSPIPARRSAYRRNDPFALDNPRKRRRRTSRSRKRKAQAASRISKLHVYQSGRKISHRGGRSPLATRRAKLPPTSDPRKLRRKLRRAGIRVNPTAAQARGLAAAQRRVYKNPRSRVRANWQTFAGGTGAHHGNSYALYLGKSSMFTIDPPQTRRGSYSLKSFNVTKPYWVSHGTFRSPQAAKAAALRILHDSMAGRPLRDVTPNPKRRYSKPMLRRSPISDSIKAVVTTMDGKPIADFAVQADAIAFAKRYAVKHRTRVRVIDPR